MRRLILIGGALCLCLLAISGPTLKLALGPDTPPNRAQELKLLEGRLESSGAGLRVLERRKLTNEGAYRGLMVAKAGCDGVAQAVPLYRNGEASGLLKRLEATGAQVWYLSDGALVATYPGTAFWINRVHARIDRLLGRTAVPRLLGIAEWGMCQVTDQIAQALKV